MTPSEYRRETGIEDSAEMPGRRLDVMLQLAHDKLDTDIARLLDARIPQQIPQGVNMAANIAEARSMTLWEFYSAVRNGGKWDYKQRGKRFEEFGNWHFGVVAKAFGFPEIVARAGAGAAQMLAGTSPEGPFDATKLVKFPFGDDIPDQQAIGNGFDSFDAANMPLDDGWDIGIPTAPIEDIRIETPTDDSGGIDITIP